MTTITQLAIFCKSYFEYIKKVLLKLRKVYETLLKLRIKYLSRLTKNYKDEEQEIMKWMKNYVLVAIILTWFNSQAGITHFMTINISANDIALIYLR